MLVFYEQNNSSAFKKIFVEQFEFAVKTYFYVTISLNKNLLRRLEIAP